MNPVVMLCRNSLELTKRAVASVLAQDIPVKLLLIDNGSTDGTKEWATELFIGNVNVEVIPLDHNIGVTKAWNNALKSLFQCAEAEYAFVVNNDVVLRPDAYRELIADGGPFVTCVGVDNEEAIKGEFVKNIRNHPDYSAYLIRREVWESIGPFDEGMIYYASDADYHVRLHQAGIPAYTIGLPFYHYASGTLKTASTEEASAIRQQADRDREYFERKWGCKVGSPEYYRLFEEVPVAAKES